MSGEFVARAVIGLDFPLRVCFYLGASWMSAVTVLPAATVTGIDFSPAASCHATRGEVPGGTSLIVNLPSSPVVAKYGWPNSQIHACIHSCASHLTLINSGVAGRGFVTENPLKGNAML